MSAKGNQVRGAYNYIKGKLQLLIGKRTGDKSLQAKGVANQARGGARYEAGKAEDAVDKLRS